MRNLHPTFDLNITSNCGSLNVPYQVYALFVVDMNLHVKKMEYV